MNQLIFSEIQSNFEFGETRHDDESEKIKWNVLGHVYEPMVGGDQKSSFAWISNDPPGTFVPPHMHPIQDEHAFIIEGEYALYFLKQKYAQLLLAQLNCVIQRTN